MEFSQFLGNIGAAAVVYLVATTSPGPANLAIMNAAMQSGRRSGLWLSSGVITGSLFWGLVAASGLSILLAAYSEITAVIMMLGGLYLAFLAYRALRSFWQTVEGRTGPSKASAQSDRSLYLQGLAIHLVNPKSALTWAAIIAIVIVPGSAPFLPLVVVVGCWLAGIVIFVGYAVFFSSRAMITWYERHGAWVELGSGILFAIFAFQLVQSGYAIASGLIP